MPEKSSRDFPRPVRARSGSPAAPLSNRLSNLQPGLVSGWLGKRWKKKQALIKPSTNSLGGVHGVFLLVI